jgi:hypothetical protein
MEERHKSLRQLLSFEPTAAAVDDAVAAARKGDAEALAESRRALEKARQSQEEWRRKHAQWEREREELAHRQEAELAEERSKAQRHAILQGGIVIVAGLAIGAGGWRRLRRRAQPADAASGPASELLTQ